MLLAMNQPSERASLLAFMLLACCHVCALAQTERYIVSPKVGLQDYVAALLKPEGSGVTTQSAKKTSGPKLIRSISDLDSKRKHFIVSATEEGAKALQQQLGPGVRVERDVRVYLHQNKKRKACSATNTSSQGTCPNCSGKVVGGRYVPYGVDMVQALHPLFLRLTGNTAVSGVTTCIIDSGIDRDHNDLRFNNLQGCEPPLCNISWYGAGQPQLNGHGTHVAGIIAGMGVAGGVAGTISQGTNLFITNVMSENGSMFASDIYIGLLACVMHLNTMKAVDPLHKAVVSMSFGAPEVLPPLLADVFAAVYQRQDILLVASAGNSGPNTTSFPAALPQVISVGAVDCRRQIASFSSTNEFVELVAPGVNNNSTWPLAGDRDSRRDATASILSRTATCNTTLSFTSTRHLKGSVGGSVSARVVECGLGLSICPGAVGNICVITGGNATACYKVNNCKAGGGVGVIFISAATDDCATVRSALSGYPPVNGTCTILGCDCAYDTTQPFPVVGLSAREGLQLRRAMATNPRGLTAQIAVSDVTYPYTEIQGTSMAAPHVSGVAAKLWNAFRACNASQIRAALTATALPLGGPGRNAVYGFGLVRAAVAANYLTKSPCIAAGTTLG